MIRMILFLQNLPVTTHNYYANALIPYIKQVENGEKK